jgi:hypothetical protein
LHLFIFISSPVDYQEADEIWAKLVHKQHLLIGSSLGEAILSPLFFLSTPSAALQTSSHLRGRHGTIELSSHSPRETVNKSPSRTVDPFCSFILSPIETILPSAASRP